MISLINPYTQDIFQEIPTHTEQELTKKLKKSAIIQAEWNFGRIEDRAILLNKLAAEIQKNEKNWCEAIVLSMGKPWKQAISEVIKSVDLCQYYAAELPRFLEERLYENYSPSQVKVCFEPQGGVLGIMPWNFPLWQVIRFAVPALAAGNTVLLKHAPNVSNCGILLEENMLDAGFPEGVFQSLILENKQIEQVIADKSIGTVAFTGSDTTGRVVAGLAGSYLKKTILELGGSDPFVVCDDANLEEAARVLTLSRCQNAGQSCVAAKRLLVQETVADVFLALLKKNFAALKLGNPLHDSTDIGPLARADLAEKLSFQLLKSQKLGAERLAGGKQQGWAFEPSIWVNVRKGMPLYEEEIFGPALAVQTFKTDLEAVSLANDTRFGLGSTVFGQEEQRLTFFEEQIKAGSVYTNTLMRSDKRLPFGGVKDSGYGRELGEFGIKEFLAVKTVWRN